MNDAERFALAITRIVGKRLMYKELIAAGEAGASDPRHFSSSRAEGFRYPFRFRPGRCSRGIRSRSASYSAIRQSTLSLETRSWRIREITKRLIFLRWPSHWFILVSLVFDGG
jgi:hypothetical protein